MGCEDGRGRRGTLYRGKFDLEHGLDTVLTHRVWGYLILAVVMLLMFSAVFNWAKMPMDGIARRAGLAVGEPRNHASRRPDSQSSG